MGPSPLYQAGPPVRVLEFCNAVDDGDDGLRCCLESICDNDFNGFLGCLTDVASCLVDGEGAGSGSRSGAASDWDPNYQPRCPPLD